MTLRSYPAQLELTPSDRVNQLTDEVTYLYQSIFSRIPPNLLIVSYIAAHSEINELKLLDDQQKLTVHRVVTKKLDAVGIEPWLRSPQRRHALSIKLLLIMYLAESDSLHPEFCRCGNGVFKGIAQLIFAGLKGFLRLILGRVQKAIYGIF